MITLALLLVQAGTTPAPPERFSVLDDSCPASTETAVVVCSGLAAPRLPLPDERLPQGPRKATGDAREGLENAGTGTCASVQRGCTVGVNMIGMGVAAIRLVGKLIDPENCCEAGEATSPVALATDVVRGAKRAFGKKPDKSNRVPIALGAPPPPMTGRLSP